MRHDPASAAIVIMLRSLKMYGLAQAVTDLIEQGAPAFEAAIPILNQLLKAEMAEREVRSIAYHTKAARFPAYKDLAGFDFQASEINEATVRPVPEKPTSQRLSPSRRSNIIVVRSVSYRPSNSSTRSSRRRPREKPGSWLKP